ncbi:MAG: hypothetical protein Q8S18_04035 [Bacteroidales bacterium]|nr:hypothetical protein [Bacteroidales bacterium]
MPRQCPAHMAIYSIDEANVPPSSDAPDVFSGKLTFTATAASTRRLAAAQLIDN